MKFGFHLNLKDLDILEASDQLAAVHQLLNSLSLNSDLNDVWSYSWGTSSFTAKKAYIQLTVSAPTSPLFKWM
jgi:hypothetical protein